MGSTNPVGERLGRYEVLEVLVLGDVVDLLLARTADEPTRHVVIERLRAVHGKDRDVPELFTGDARRALALDHPQIASVDELGEHAGAPYLVRAYVHGEDLRQLLARVFERSAQIPIEHVIAIGAAIAGALHHAHEATGKDGQPLEVVHRGVSPSAVVFGYDGTISVTEFAHARATLRTAQAQPPVLRTKAPYMSPEQCSGKKLDRRSDVFSVGTVLYELVTARRLFKASNDYLTLTAIDACKVPPPSSFRAEVPKPLEDLILRALSREPAARYQTAAELLTALDGLGALGPRSGPEMLAGYLRSLFGERPLPWTAAGTSPAPALVDFDGKGTGLAPPPAEALQPKAIPRAVGTRSSPIEIARAQLAVAVLATSSNPVVIPGGAPVAAAPGPRKKSATRAPIPAPTRQRPKTIQIPTTKLEAALAAPRTDVAPSIAVAPSIPAAPSIAVAPSIPAAPSIAVAPSITVAPRVPVSTAQAQLVAPDLAAFPPPPPRTVTNEPKAPVPLESGADGSGPAFVAAVEPIATAVESDRPKRRHDTEPVRPLPPPRRFERDDEWEPSPPRNRTIPIAIGGVVALALVLVLAIGLSGGGTDAVSAPPAPQIASPPPTEAPTTPPPTAIAGPAITTPAITTPAITTPAITKPAITKPAITKPAITKPAITKPAITRPVANIVARPVTKPVKPPVNVASRPVATPAPQQPVTKPVPSKPVQKPVKPPIKKPPPKRGSWDPDSLFPKK